MRWVNDLDEPTGSHSLARIEQVIGFGSADRTSRGTDAGHAEREKSMAKKKTVDTGIVDCTEQKRLNEAREAGIPWKKWGPYLSERQ